MGASLTKKDRAVGEQDRTTRIAFIDIIFRQMASSKYTALYCSYGSLQIYFLVLYTKYLQLRVMFKKIISLKLLYFREV